MAKWFFEPGHTAAEFCVRHMMVTYVRGHFKNVHGALFFNPAAPHAASVVSLVRPGVEPTEGHPAVRLRRVTLVTRGPREVVEA